MRAAFRGTPYDIGHDMLANDIARRLLDESLDISITGAHTVPECVAMRIANVVRGISTDAILQWADESDLESAIAKLRLAFLCLVATIRGEEVRA